ncbi:MAG TPA: BON domain-containing protein [Pirellulaceae bacterium]
MKTIRPINSVIMIRALPLFGLVCSLALANVCFAQARGTTTNSMFGSSQVGNPSGASASGSGSGMTMGQSSTNGSASTPGGTSSMGNSLGLGANMQNFSAGGATGFVGSSANSVANQSSRVGTQGAVQAGRVNFGSLTNLMNQSRQNQFNQQQAQKAQRSASQPKGQFRVPLRLGFQPTPREGLGIGTALTQRMIKMPALSQTGRITAGMEGQTAVLRGTVPTEADRSLAEGLAKLEPGVLAVRNELVVGPTESQPAEPLPQPPSGQ